METMQPATDQQHRHNKPSSSAAAPASTAAPATTTTIPLSSSTTATTTTTTTTTVSTPTTTTPSASATTTSSTIKQQRHHHHQSTRTSTIGTSTPTPRGEAGGAIGGTSFDSQAQSSSMAYQHKHALHRLRRLKKRAPHRDLVISFVPRLRTSIINRLDFFNRYSKQEQEVLSCFDFLDELVINYCDEGIESSLLSQKFYQTMIHDLI